MSSNYLQHRKRDKSSSYFREDGFEREDEAAALELYDVIFQSSGKIRLGKALSMLSHQNEDMILNCTGVENFMRSFRDIFKFEFKKDYRTDLLQEKVKTIMPLKFCPEEARKNGCQAGKRCSNLHLCPYFVKGNCIYRDKCWMSHELKDDHTMSLLREIRLADIDRTLWLRILKKLLTDTMMERGASTHDCPEICKFYNNQGGCREANKCAFLHICQHFVDGTCKFGDGCKRDHDLLKDRHNREVFRHFGLRDFDCQKLMIILKGRERREKGNKSCYLVPGASNVKKRVSSCSVDFTVLGQSPEAKKLKVTQSDQSQATCTLEKQSTDICGFHLRGQCNYGKKCMNQHRELPYQWQLMDTSSSAPSWTDLSEDWNIMLERSYCDPNINSVIFYHQGQSLKTDFDKMLAVAEETACPPLQMRRLSTESSAEAPPGHVFSTRWFWYWQDETAKWQNYDSPGDGIKPNSTCSKFLETDFLQGQKSHSFSVGHLSYKLSYKNMNQKNVESRKKRTVRRRPEFVAKEKMREIAKKRKEAVRFPATLQSSSSCVSDITSLPLHWTTMDDKTGYVLIDLSPTSQEYTNVKKGFQDTMTLHSCVKKIERIQNPDLWTAFVQKKGRMEKKTNNPPKEMAQLFHGTTNDIVNAICQQGFDWRMCGKHGTLYGKGSYFARDASYSHSYTDHFSAHGADRRMLVARVLVGSYVKGNSSFTRPPPKDASNPHGDLHDSCVDNISNPSIYVVFDNNQCYPEYLITFSN